MGQPNVKSLFEQYNINSEMVATYNAYLKEYLKIEDKEESIEKIIGHQEQLAEYGFKFDNLNIIECMPDRPFVVKIGKVFYFCKDYLFGINTINDSPLNKRIDTSHNKNAYNLYSRILKDYTIEYDNIQEFIGNNEVVNTLFLINFYLIK